MPVYAATQFKNLMQAWPMIALTTVGVLFGTVAGKPILLRIPERFYRTLVSVIVLGLGTWMPVHSEP